MADDTKEPTPALIRRLVPFLPGLLGALLVAAGLAWIWPPLGLIALGAFLLLVDRRIP